LVNRFWRALRQGDPDIIWLQREVLPFLPFGLERILLAGKPVVIDFDDAHHLYYKNARSRLVRGLFEDKVESLMRHATTVVVGNPTLEAYARGAGAESVVMIPSAVDVARLKASSGRPEKFTVGWIGTPVTAEHSLHLVREPLKKFIAETGSNCILFGAGEAVPDIEADRLPWSEAGEAEFFSQVSVGICPLEDTAWNQGKSGYKIIQYMAAGKPALVSPIGIASELTIHDKTGSHCRTEDDWYAMLMRLYNDDALCSSMGARAQAEAEEKYDTAIAAEQLRQVFETCLGT
nr:glycosyltransferase [Alphaproteobacteria bacterium]